MPKSSPNPVGTRLRPDSERRPLQGGWFFALQFVAGVGLALFVVLYRGPLPDEMLAAYAASWTDLGQAVQ